ncbi:MAG: chromosomal replication initiator protein DnaA [Candidatus Omnitrophota bacterium]|nr:chromosomal replication initiator protein DnaA [bacterium]MBU3930041.1 chromosomal replication initiator protein DnaA [bacterium]MDO9514435.1 chromosomal replication initiator protein DnaA [Elusimicrobiota bacterium]
MDNFEIIWKKIVNNLRLEITDETYKLWLEPAIPTSLEKDKLSVKVPNKFFVRWLSEHYCERIDNILKSSDPCLKVEFYTDKVENKVEPDSVEARELNETLFLPKKFVSKYSFDNFVIGQSNHFAHAASLAITKNPGNTYNPLFLYGGVGLGKTHLLNAIGIEIKKHFPAFNIIYVTSEKFTNDLIEYLKNNRIAEFRIKYRNVDLLLIDDIQFLTGKEMIQQEFFHTFNALYDRRKQIVLSSDSSPKDMGSLEERLRSRFQWGVVADIQPPDLETRVAIIKKKIEAEKISIPDDVLYYIASNIKNNIRTLEGAILSIAAYSSLTETSITIEKAKEYLKTVITESDIEKDIGLDTIQSVVSNNFNLSVADLKGKKRTESVVFPRQIAMYLSRILTSYSTTEIGEFYGGRDHSTVLHAGNKIKNKITKDPYFAALLNKITKQVKESA